MTLVSYYESILVKAPTQIDSMEANFTHSFADCMQAAADSNQILVAHMWENHKGYYLSPAAHAERRKEVADVLAVMAGKANAYYNDEGFFLHDSFPNRVLRGSPAGFIGLASSPVTLSNLPVFPNGASTGLLLKNPIPIFVSHKDSWSVYFECPEDIPEQEAWDIKCDKTGNYPKSDVKLSHSLLRDNVHIRKRIAGKLCIFRTEILPRYNKAYPKRISEVFATQMLEKQPYLLLDPHDLETQERARKTYRDMLKILAPVARRLHSEQYPETDVNATLEHAVGILAYNRSAPLPRLDNISECLKDRLELTAALYQSFSEYDQLRIILRESGISRIPTIVIYQPGCPEAPLLHFPPLEENRQFVETTLRQNGYKLF